MIIITNVVLVFLIATCGFVESTPTFASTDGTFRANWTISESSVTFMMSGLGTGGWVGIGWNMNGGTPNSDVVVGWIDNSNRVTVMDRWASTKTMTSPDTSLGGTNDVTNIQGYVETYLGAQWTTFIFTRPLNSGDVNDVSITNTAMHLIYFVGPSGSVDYTANTLQQQYSTQGDVIVNFFDISSTSVVTTRSVSSASASSTTPVVAPASTNSSTNYSTYASPDGTFKVKWTINQSNITFIMSGKTSTGWVGIGWNANGGMPKADMVVGWVDNNGAAVVFDSWSPDRNMPVQDTSLGGDSYLSNVSASIDKINNVKWMTITFTRPLSVTDKYDVSITNQQLHMLWAVGPDGSVNYATNQYAQHSTKGDILINLFSGGVSTNNVFFKVHAVLMVVGWTMMLFVGTFIARYLKPLTKNWFKAHVALQTIGCAVVLVAFALVLVYYNGGFNVGWHQIVGIVVIAGMVVQPIIGGIADKMYDPSRSKAPIWPDQIHWWIGRVTSIVALVAIFLGIREYMPDSIIAYVLFSAYCILTFIIVLIAELKVGSKHENEIYEEDMTVRDGAKVEKRKVLVARNLFVAWIVIGFSILIAFMIFIVLYGISSIPQS